MTDILPTLIDGAIVLNLDNTCQVKGYACEQCPMSAVFLHNWLRTMEVHYGIFDFQEEKEICPVFLEELIKLRKRLGIPFLFVGVMKQAQDYLELFNYGDSYPVFVTPEDAVRALRMQHPGITEGSIKPSVIFDHSIVAHHEERSSAI